MFFEALDAVFRAGRLHGAILTVDGRDVLPVHLDQKPKGVWGCIALFPMVLLMALLAPRTVEGGGISRRCQAEKGYNQHAGNPDLR